MKYSELCNHLMELDRVFAKTTGEIGLEGWVQFFDENGAMVPSQGEIIRGKDAIRQAMSASFGKQGYSLEWEPEYADASLDGSLGYTYGIYIRTITNEQGHTEKSTGRYTSIWKRQSDGSYKIILDMGN